MGWTRRLLIALGALVVLVGLGLAALLLFVDPNDYKPALEQAVKERYNRTLVIDGDIRLSVVPGLGLDISGVSLSEPGSTQVFAAVDNARVAVAWWPLLSRHLVIDHLSITRIKANVVRDAEGRFNFHDLMLPDEGATTTVDATTDSDKPAEIQLNIGGINLDGGEIAFRDEMYDMSMRMGALTMSARGIALGEPFDVSLNGRMLGQSPRADATVQMQGRFTVDPYRERYAIGGLDLRVAGVLPSVKATSFLVRGDASYDAAAGALDVNGLNLAFQGDVALATPLSGVDAQASIKQLSADLRAGKFQLEGSVVKAGGRFGSSPFSFGLNAPAVRITEDAARAEPVEATLTLTGDRTIDAQLSLNGLAGNAARFEVGDLQLKATHQEKDRKVELTAAAKMTGSLTDRNVQLSGLDAKARIAHPSLPGGSMLVPLSGELGADFAKLTAQANIRAKVDGGDLAATVQVKGFERPDIRFELAAHTLDLDKLWPATSDAPAPAANSGATAEKSATGEAPPLDIGFLRNFDANGKFRVDEFHARGVRAQQLSGNVAVAKGRASLSDLTAGFYEGRIAANAFADANGNKLGVKANLSGVAVQPVLQALADYDGLSGTGNIQVALTTAAKTASTLRSGLDGDVTLQVRNGKIKGFDIAQSLREFKAMIGAGKVQAEEADQSRSTDFTELKTHMTLAQGVGTLRELDIAAPLLRVSEGDPATVNLVDETLDLELQVKVVNTSTGQDGKALEELRDITIPILLTGPLRSPRYAIQWTEVGSQALKRGLQNQLERQVDKLLDRNNGDSGQGATDENPTGRILGEALKGLFNKP